MRILIATSTAQFFQQLHSICRQVQPSIPVDHISTDLFLLSPPGSVRPGDVVITDGTDSRLTDLPQNRQNAFAVIGTVCQNNRLSLQWVPVSRSDLILWLRELPSMTSELSVMEDVVFQSTHVRLARLAVPTKCRLIPEIRDRLLRGIGDFQVAEGTRRNHFCMALEEALNNAFYHGNLEISSELKEDGSSRFVDLATEREQLSPWCQRSVNVTELVSAFGIWITIQDEGRGFDVRTALERCNDPEALLASGRGLLLMRAFSDEMFFNDSGNEVTLVLYGENADRELPLGTAGSSGSEQRLVLN